MTGRQHAKPDRTALGIATILASVLVMAFADAIVKLVSTDLTVWQVFAVRSLFGLPIMIALLLATGLGLVVQAPLWAFIRSLLLVLTWLAFYASLPVLDLSLAAVAAYTNPIMIALLSALLIGEPVTGRQWAGVLLGFLGVVTILQPGTDAFSWFTILPLMAAAFYALAMVITRSRCQNEAPLTLALVLHGLFLLTGLIATALLAIIGLDGDIEAAFPFLLGSWAPMDGRAWGLMALLAVLSVVYFVGVARAYQIAAPSVIATFDYAYLISAAFWGFVFFAERPDLLTLVGMVLITVAGLLVAAQPSKKHRPEESKRA